MRWLPTYSPVTAGDNENRAARLVTTNELRNLWGEGGGSQNITFYYRRKGGGGVLTKGCTKLFLAGNQINLTMNWLLDFMRVFLLKVMNNAFGFFLIVNYGYSSTD